MHRVVYRDRNSSNNRALAARYPALNPEDLYPRNYFTLAPPIAIGISTLTPNTKGHFTTRVNAKITWHSYSLYWGDNPKNCGRLLNFFAFLICLHFVLLLNNNVVQSYCINKEKVCFKTQVNRSLSNY